MLDWSISDMKIIHARLRSIVYNSSGREGPELSMLQLIKEPAKVQVDARCALMDLVLCTSAVAVIDDGEAPSSVRVVMVY